MMLVLTVQIKALHIIQRQRPSLLLVSANGALKKVQTWQRGVRS